MARIAEPYLIIERGKSFQFTLNPTCGLPQRVCAEWRRKSFRTLPDELSHCRDPKSGREAKSYMSIIIAYLRKRLETEGTVKRIQTDITVGAWLEKFTAIDTSPRTGINASKNKPYSVATVKKTYKSYYSCHIEKDPITKLKMLETEEEDIREFISRMSIKKLSDGRAMGGRRTFVGVTGLVRMAFGEFQRQNRKWLNPFFGIDKASYNKRKRDALPEDEMLRLFAPGVLKSAMEFGVCAAIFLSGLRRSEVSALKPEDLDWHTPKIIVRRAWQDFDSKDRVLGPPKSKREREAPFDPLLQQAVKNIWNEYGKHEFVFCWKDGSIIGANWTYKIFKKWLKDAGIDLAGRDIVPHSSRHTLATLLIDKGVSLKYVQDLLGHQTLEVTKGYLHSTKKTIREIGAKITQAMVQGTEKEEKIIEFKAG